MAATLLCKKSMKKRLMRLFVALAMVMTIGAFSTQACTNYIVTKGASTDGSVMVTYAADSHVLYGELYHWAAATYPEGTMMDVYEWDTKKYLGKIKQAAQTYNVVGNMNEFQLAISETTFTGRDTLGKQTGAIMDYGSLIYITLQRAKNAREAIRIMGQLVAEYGYASTGESMSIIDPNEAWILEIIGKGNVEKGAVWVARRVPDGYVAAHANQARITQFPLASKKNPNSITFKNIAKIADPNVDCVYTEDVISFARKMGFVKPDVTDAEFSFSDTYAPVDFSAARFSEIRVWSMFKDVNRDMWKHFDYAKGGVTYDAKTGYANNRMPLWILPEKKVSLNDLMYYMRDHLEGTELDMSKDVGAGPYGCPYRSRPLTFDVDGKTYLNERATGTQQTGFSFVAQCRSWLPNAIGGIIWFGVDDAASSVYYPQYSCATAVPKAFERGNGSMMVWSDTAAFWAFNMVTNLAYTRYSDIHPEIAAKIKGYERKYEQDVKKLDDKMVELYKTDPKRVVETLTLASEKWGNELVADWKVLYQQLFMKYMDFNIKTIKEGDLLPTVKQPGVGAKFNKLIVEDTKEKLRYN